MPTTDTKRGRQPSRAAKKPSISARLGAMLIRAGYIQREQLAEAARYQREHGGKLPHILIHLGHLQPGQLHEFLEKHGPMPSVDLARFRSFPNPSELIPKEYAVRHQVFPIDRMANLLTIATSVPLDDAMIEELEGITGLHVKPVLCNGDDIRRVIEEQYPRRRRLPGRAVEPAQAGPSESEIRLSAITEILKGIKQLPTLSDTVRRVHAAVSRPDAGVREVSEIIEHDPPITVNVLKLANSAAYGFRNKIDDIHRAAALLGLHELESIVMSSAVITATEKSGHFNHKAYWNDALFGAFAARTIAQTVGRRLDGAAFTAGLLHDIGRFVLSEAAEARYAKVRRRLRGEELLKAENEHLGIAHPEAGYLLVNQWELPVEIAESIRLHHRPVAAAGHSTLAGILTLAAAMTEARHHGLNPLETCAPVLQQLKMPSSTGLQIYSTALRTMSDTAET